MHVPSCQSCGEQSGWIYLGVLGGERSYKCSKCDAQVVRSKLFWNTLLASECKQCKLVWHARDIEMGLCPACRALLPDESSLLIPFKVKITRTQENVVYIKAVSEQIARSLSEDIFDPDSDEWDDNGEPEYTFAKVEPRNDYDDEQLPCWNCNRFVCICNTDSIRSR